ncbi:hypothetical protein AVV44_gp155 [Cronobacter phage S13]|jgi:hypothetical protein|uniref:Uncharacterized protein n=1 Tax=Cronobacter phage LPCS28 TaxID=2924885 RepID=A0AAE9K554_9CAUD|nr:hypothetical protein AVV44_gp155 [Cronobacter phage S13]YP_010665738.1 hypothetical protein PQB73_gp020 [Cronobacter phage LPCS28]AIA64954.1 hypothetical protein S13_155 [Cronobacter phage S13]UNY46927.1 hypothetical protein EHEKIMEA_00020 [Cronobacter phage LPCS28]
MIQINIIDGLMEPVASIVMQDYMLREMRDHVIGIISMYSDAEKSVNAEILVAKYGVHSRHYLTRSDMKIIHEMFDEIVDVLKEEVQEILDDRNKKAP